MRCSKLCEIEDHCVEASSAKGVGEYRVSMPRSNLQAKSYCRFSKILFGAIMFSSLSCLNLSTMKMSNLQVENC